MHPSDARVAEPARTVTRGCLALFVTAAAIGLAACGSSSNSASGASATSKQEQARLQAAQCLRQHGVNVPDPGTSAASGPPTGLRDIPQATRDAARQACQKYLRDAFTPLSAADRIRFRDPFVQYAACMRANGVNLPDPGAAGPGGGGGGGGAFRGFRQLRTQPNFQAANDKCRSKRPQRPGGGGGGLGRFLNGGGGGGRQ